MRISGVPGEHRRGPSRKEVFDHIVIGTHEGRGSVLRRASRGNEDLARNFEKSKSGHRVLMPHVKDGNSTISVIGAKFSDTC